MSQNTARPLRRKIKMSCGYLYSGLVRYLQSLTQNTTDSTSFRDIIIEWNLQVDIMLHQSHASITWPTLLVVVTYNVLIVGIRMLC